MRKLIILWISVLMLLTTSCSTPIDPAPMAVSDKVPVSMEQPEASVIESPPLDNGKSSGNDKEVTTVILKTPLVFRVEMISSEMGLAMTDKSFHENEHLQLDELRYLQMGYIGFDGEEHQGSMVVHQAIANQILEIFQELFDARYPIEHIETIDKYDGDDDASMVANNTSAFNYRVVSGSSKLSNHAFGLAVDINPLINPWVTGNGIFPAEASLYADRNMEQQGMIKKGDACYVAFTSRGFKWGGDWKNSKDYQHFDITMEGIND